MDLGRAIVSSGRRLGIALLAMDVHSLTTKRSEDPKRKEKDPERQDHRPEQQKMLPLEIEPQKMLPLEREREKAKAMGRLVRDPKAEVPSIMEFTLQPSLAILIEEGVPQVRRTSLFAKIGSKANVLTVTHASFATLEYAPIGRRASAKQAKVACSYTEKPPALRALLHSVAEKLL